MKIKLNDDDIKNVNLFLRIIKDVGYPKAFSLMKEQARTQMQLYTVCFLETMVETGRVDTRKESDLMMLASLMVSFIHGWTFSRESLKRGEV